MGSSHSVEEYGVIPSQLLAMQATRDGKNILSIDKFGLCKVHSINGNQCQRQLSVIPTTYMGSSGMFIALIVVEIFFLVNFMN